MTETNYRREFWQTIYAAYVGAANAVNEKGGANWADFALKALDERFPAEKAEFDFEGIQSEAKLLTDLLHSIDGLKKATAPKKEGIDVSGLLEADNIRLRAIVDQYSAQLADYRKAGPANDIEIERLTREGLIKDQKIKEAADDVKFCHLHIKQLDEMVQLAVRVDEEKDKRIAELEKYEALLSGAEASNVELSMKVTELEGSLSITKHNAKILCDQIDDRDKRIAELEALPMPKTTADDLIRALTEGHDKRIAELEKVNRDINAFLDKQAETIRERENYILTKNARIAELEQALRAVGGSRLKEIDDELEEVEQPKPRTAIEWLEDLPEPYRSQALANAKNRNIRYQPNEKAGSLTAALIFAFHYSMAPEGWEYWEEVVRKLGNGGPLVIDGKEDPINDEAEF